MPELPETETIARDLDAIVRGAVIQSARVTRPNVLRELDAETFIRGMTGAAIQRVWRRAKLIVVDLATATTATTNVSAHELCEAPPQFHLVVQPRFTGGLFIDATTPRDADSKYECVSFLLADTRWLSYRDVRRLGTVSLMATHRFAAYEKALGAEPLDLAFTPNVLSVLLRATRRSVKALLMDQRRVAGIGNIYANEALWLAGIDPSREARTLTSQEASSLHAALQGVLTASIAARGTSFRDYRDAHGERGAFVKQLAAYGRNGQPCLRCGDTLVGTHAIDGRSTVFCTTCQR